MSWQDEVDEIERRRGFAQEMGGPEGVARQRKRGKYTVRERVDKFVDAGTFREFMGLAGSGQYEGGTLVRVTPRVRLTGSGLSAGAKLSCRRVTSPCVEDLEVQAVDSARN